MQTNSLFRQCHVVVTAKTLAAAELLTDPFCLFISFIFIYLSIYSTHPDHNTIL